MPRAMLANTICGLVLICGAATTSPAADPDRGFASTDKVVLAYDYIWFDEDDGLKSTADGGREEQLQGLQPLAGAYNSWDPAIIEKHMQQTNRARIDALAVSWWHETRENGPNQILEREATGWRNEATVSAQPLPPAVRYEFLQRDEPRPLRIHRLEIDLTAPDIELTVAMGADPDGDGPVEALLTPPRALADDAGMLCAVNTNAWTMFPDPATGNKPGYVVGGAADIKGWALSSQGERSRPEEGYWSCWMDRAGRCHLGESWQLPRNPAATDQTRRWAVSGFGGLLRNGTILPTANDVRHPRTALGLNRNAHQLTLLVVDGRQPSVSEGVSEYELAELLLACGCSDAMNLDGGGSSIMLLPQSAGGLTVANHPSDASGDRPVPVVLGVRRKP